MHANDTPPNDDAPPQPAAAAVDLAAIAPHARKIDLGGRTLWLLGTAHVSRASADEARDLVEAVRPDVVAIELCAARDAALRDPDRWKKLDIFQVFREGKALFLLANLAIGAWQRRIGAELGVEPGAEMIAASEAAERIGARVALIDRDIQATLRRTWGLIPWWRKFGLLGAISGSLVAPETVSAEDIEAMKSEGKLEDMLTEFTRVLPEVKGPLIDERDRYMASHLDEMPEQTVVAVVGAAHVPGMVQSFGSATDRAALEVVPPPSSVGRILRWAIPALVATALFLAWQRGSAQLAQELIWIWVVANMIPAAVLAAVAGAKPLSVIAAAVASPITSLNPMVGAAMVVGPLEAWLRKPTVEDCERIADDVQSLGGLYRNPFTRVLLVAVMASMGSALGAWIAGALMVRSLTGG